MCGPKSIKSRDNQFYTAGKIEANRSETDRAIALPSTVIRTQHFSKTPHFFGLRMLLIAVLAMLPQCPCVIETVSNIRVIFRVPAAHGCR